MRSPGRSLDLNTSAIAISPQSVTFVLASWRLARLTADCRRMVSNLSAGRALRRRKERRVPVGVFRKVERGARALQITGADDRWTRIAQRRVYGWPREPTERSWPRSRDQGRALVVGEAALPVETVPAGSATVDLDARLAGQPPRRATARAEGRVAAESHGQPTPPTEGGVCRGRRRAGGARATRPTRAQAPEGYSPQAKPRRALRRVEARP